MSSATSFELQAKVAELEAKVADDYRAYADRYRESAEIKEMNVPFNRTLTNNTPIYSEPHTGVSASDMQYNGARQGPPRDTWI